MHFNQKLETYTKIITLPFKTSKVYIDSMMTNKPTPHIHAVTIDNHLRD